MNKVFKVIWSKAKNCYVVASELAKSHTKSPNSGIVGDASLAFLESKINMDLSKGFVAGVFPMVNRPVVKSSDFKITVAAIVKNEAENVPTWVQSARSCADEIVVVDTGSTDGTVERFADYGIKCFHYDWNDDFASAKNYMISLCHGDWIVLLDGDEWFREGCDVRKAIAKHHGNPVTKAIIADWICLDKDRNNAVMFSGGAVRAFRNQPDVRYFRKVHENLTIKLENFVFEPDFKMYHTGYSGSVNRSKHERNLRIMRTMFDFDNGKVEYPTDWRYIEDTYAGLGEYNKALWAADKMISYGIQEYSASAWITKFNVLFAMKTPVDKMIQEFEYCFKTVPSVSGFRFLATIYYIRNGLVDKGLSEYIEGLRMLMGPQDRVAMEHTYWRMYLPEASALVSAVYLQNKQVEASLYACKVSEQYCGKNNWTDMALADIRRVMNTEEVSVNIADKLLLILNFSKKAVLATALASSLINFMPNVVFAADYAAGGGCANGGTNSIAIGYNANSHGSMGVAVGQYASAKQYSTVALGPGAYAGACNALAVGGASSVADEAQYSVAIGAQSYAADSNVVSFGHIIGQCGGGVTYDTNLYRRLVNVADGTGDHDVATYGQTKSAIKGLSVSGKTITYTKIDGTTGTITTQDTNTTYSNMTAATASAAGKAGLVPAPAAGKQTAFLRGDGTWVVPTNTTYGNTSAAELKTGTATAQRAMTAAVISPYLLRNVSSSSYSGDGTAGTSDGWGTINKKSYTNVLAMSTSTGGGIVFADKNQQTSMQIDGKFYQNEGQYEVLDTSSTLNASKLSGLTKAQVTTALGYTPPTADTNTHYTTHLYVGSGTAANAATTNGNTKIALTDDSTVRNTLTIKGAGKTTVTSDANGVITITSTDANTTYSNMKGATASAAGTAGLVPAPAAGKQTAFLRGDGTWVVPTDTNTHYTTHLYAGSGTAANAATTNGNTKIALTDDSTVRNTLTIKGTGATTVTSDANGVITINSTDNNTTYSAATQSANGLMTAADKKKLDGIATGANAYSLPTATDSVLGGVKVGSNLTNTNGTISLTKANVTAALGYTPPTQDTNTTYDNMSDSELSTGTATTARSISAKTIADYVTGKVSAETTARTTAVSDEATARTDADTALSTRIDGTIKGLSISGQTITYTKGDGTTGSITTQDNNTTYSAGNGLELDGSQFKAKAGANVTVDTDGISVAGNGTVADGNTGLISGGTLYNEVHIGTDGTYVKGGQSVAQNFSSLDTQVKANKDTLAEHAVSISNLQSASGNHGSAIATKANRDMDDLTETGSGVIKNLAKASVNVAGSALASVQKTDVNGVDTYTVSIAADGTVSDGNASLVSGGTVYNALQSVKSELSDTLLAAQGTLQGSIDGKADVSLGNIDNNGENVVRSLAKESVKMIAGTHTTVTEGADGDAKTYTVDVKTDGTVSENNTGIVTGGSVYDAIQAEQAARNAGDIALSGRIGTIESDKNYVLKDSSVSDNLVVLDGKVKLNADDITGLKDLDNITAAGETVIRDLSKGSISMTGSGYATVTKSAENGVDTYNVSVKAEGSVSNGNTGLVDGGTVYDAIGNAVTVSENLTAAVLANKADKDAYNVTDSVAWAAKLDTGAVAENNGELVSGGKVYTAVNTGRQAVEAKIGTISEDGRYISVAHNVSQNLSSLDTGLKTTAEGLAAEVVNRTAADTELGNRIGTVTSDGNYILASNTVSQNLSALDSKIGTASSAEGTYTSGSNTINANLKALDTQVKAVGEALTFTDANSVKYDGAEKTKVTLAGNGGTTVGNVKDAILSAESSEAVTGRQLYATNTNIATEIRARQDADTSLSNRIGTVASDGNYIKKADSASANLVTLDWMLKSTSDALATEKAERETVNTEIQGQVNRLSGNTVQYESASMDTVTMKGASGTKLTNLQEGLLAENSSDAVTGRQLYAVSRDLLKEVSARAAADTALGQRIDDVITSYTVADNALGSRIDKESEARAQADSALDKRIGKLASDGAYIDKNKDVSSNLFSLDRQLKTTTENLSSVVAGNTTELSERIGTLDSDGNYIEKSANNSVYKNISKLDSKLKETSDGLSGEKVERMEADKELSARIGILASDGKYIKKNSDVSQNLFALDSQLRDNTDKISENKDAINALSEKSAADISGLEKRIQANKEGVEAVNRQEGAILPVGEARSDEFVRGKTVYEYLNGDELRMGRNSTRLSVGKGSLASGNQSIALGFDNEVSGNNSGSFGDPNTVTGDGSYAIGNDITIGGNNTFVFGSNVEANVDNAVVLGHESVAEKDAVSVGSEGKERQIKHVAPGTDPNDAATVGQLEAMGMNAYNNAVALSDGINQLDNKINKVGAGAAALASLHPIDMDNKFGIAAGVGNYRNATAMAMGLFYRPKENIMFNVGGTIGNGASMISAGVTVALDKGFSTSKAAMAKAIRAQAEENQRLKNQLGVQQAELEKQKEEIAELREMVKKLAKSS